MSDNQIRIFSEDDQQALEGGDFEPFRRQFDSSLYSGGKVSHFNIGSILFLKSCLDTHTVVPGYKALGSSMALSALNPGSALNPVPILLSCLEIVSKLKVDLNNKA